jgi:hypothetical protein
MYFDSESESVGYLIGSDSRAAAIKPLSDQRVFQADKSFCGKNTVGFIRGTLSGTEAELQDGFFGRIQSLEEVFDDIDEGVDYSHVPLLKDSNMYALLVGKQSNASLDLFTVSNAREKDPNTAIRLHRLTPQMYHTENHALMWYALFTRDYVVMRSEKKFGIKEAQELLVKLLTIPSDDLRQKLGVELDYEAGKPNMYRIDFQGIQRI